MIMRNIKARLLVAIALLTCAIPAVAQNNFVTPGGSTAAGAINMCINGSNQAVPCSSGTPLQIAGTFSATLGGFAPGGTFATLTATNASASVALPAGAVVLFQNTGTTTVSCTLGIGSATATANEIQVAASSTVSVTVGTNTFGACIDQTGSVSNVVVLAGGSGLFTGIGGGGAGGGGGGAITIASGAVASGAYASGSIASGALASGSMVDLVATQTPIAAGAATATKGIAIGGQFDTTQKTLTNGQQGSIALSPRAAMFVAVGADGFAVTNAGTFAVTQATGTNLHAVLDTTSTTAVTQATAANLNATVVGTGTFATQSTLAAETTKVIGTTRTLGNVGAVVDFAGQNAASPANSWLIGGQFNTTPTTLTTGNSSPLQMDSAGNLLVNIKTGASSGAVAQGSTTSGQTGLLVQCAVTTGAPTYTTAQTDPLNCDTGGNLRVNVMAGPPGLAQGSTTSGQTGSMIMGAVTTAAPTNTTGQTAYASLATTGGLRIAGDGTKLLVTPDSVALPSNQSVNVNQIGGTGVIADPCQAIAKTYTPISITTATTTRIIAPTAAKKTYICNMYLFANGADNVAIVEGTGGTCGTGTAGVLGGTTAANGLNLLANEGSNMGVGSSAVLATAGANVDFCLITSAAISLAGHVAWVQQ